MLLSRAAIDPTRQATWASAVRRYPAHQNGARSESEAPADYESDPCTEMRVRGDQEHEPGSEFGVWQIGHAADQIGAVR